jgi:hypothetical protein
MRKMIVATLVLTLLAREGAAQTPDTARTRRELRSRVEQNFLTRAQESMGLTEAQATQLQEVTGRTAERRRELEIENRRLHQALARELRPGVAADARVIRRTLDSLVAVRIAVAELPREEQRELAGFLTEVQRAQFYLQRERLAHRIETVRQRHPAPPAPRGRR